MSIKAYRTILFSFIICLLLIPIYDNGCDKKNPLIKDEKGELVLKNKPIEKTSYAIKPSEKYYDSCKDLNLIQLSWEISLIFYTITLLLVNYLLIFIKNNKIKKFNKILSCILYGSLVFISLISIYGRIQFNGFMDAKLIFLLILLKLSIIILMLDLKEKSNKK